MVTKSNLETSNDLVDSVSNDYAGFWRRFLAYFVDSLILGIIGMALGFSFAFGSKGENASGASGLNFLVGAAYFIFFWVNQNGQTLGKRLMAIRVVREDGKALDWGTAILRYIGYLISSLIFCLGFLWIIWDKRKQGWHDKIAKTLVVKTADKPKTGLVAGLLILLTLIMVAFLIGVAAIGYAIFKDNKGNIPKEFSKEFAKVVPTMTQDDLNLLATDTFNSINEYRVKKNYNPLEMDNKLCAYAVRRVDSFIARKGYDQGKGLYEDLANPQISGAYFIANAQVNESFFVVDEFAKGSEIASSMANGEKPSSLVTDENVIKGCVQTRGSYMEVVGSTK